MAEDDLVIQALNGVGVEFKEICAGIHARESAISFEEPLEKLVEHERVLNLHQSAKGDSIVSTTFIQIGANKLNRAGHYHSSIVFKRMATSTILIKREGTTISLLTTLIRVVSYVNIVRNPITSQKLVGKSKGGRINQLQIMPPLLIPMDLGLWILVLLII